jgi:hypothetical protein
MIKRLLCLPLFVVPAFAQTHTLAATDTNNIFMRSNTFSDIGNTLLVDGTKYATIPAAVTDCLAIPNCSFIDATPRPDLLNASGTPSFTLGAVKHPMTLKLPPGQLTVNGTILVQTGSGIVCSSPLAGEHGTSFPYGCMIKENNNQNLSSIVQIIGAYATLRDIVVDGNFANNPTSGVCVWINQAPTNDIQNVNAQNCGTHGWMITSTLSGNQSSTQFLRKIGGNQSNADGIYIQNTCDVFVGEGSQLESNGFVGTVNTNGAAVTWVSGNKWSTDSSLIGTRIRINRVLYTIAAVPSTTTLTLAATAGVQNGVALNWGNGAELNNACATRFEHVDFGGNWMDGLLIYGTATGRQASFNMVGGSSEFGNNFQSDVEIYGFDPVGAANIGFSNIIVGNVFSVSSNRTPDNTWPAIFIQDGAWDVIGPNTYYGSLAPNRVKYWVQLNETAAGRALPHFIAGSFPDNARYGTAAYLDGNQNKSQLYSNNPSGLDAVITKLALTSITVASLPPAAAGNAGQMRTISDSTPVATEGQTCVGGSTNTALAFSNGTVWKCF